MKKAIELARRIYEKDRFAEAPATVAAKHLGYAGLNGGSRPVLSALKKFGLLEYIGSGENLKVKLTPLAQKILVPLSDEEKSQCLWESFNSPQVHIELHDAYPDWNLPSDETLAALLERHYRFQPAAIKSFMADLREGLEYLRLFAIDLGGSDNSGQESLSRDSSSVLLAERDSTTSIAWRSDLEGSDRNEETSVPSPGGFMKLPMPGSGTYIVIPEELTPSEGKRVLAWLKRVVTPAVEFACNQEEFDEAE